MNSALTLQTAFATRRCWFNDWREVDIQSLSAEIVARQFEQESCEKNARSEWSREIQLFPSGEVFFTSPSGRGRELSSG